MSLILSTLWPLFALILAGHVMKRYSFPSEAFWAGADRLNYFVLFPALLFGSLVHAPLHNVDVSGLLNGSLLALAACVLGLCLVRRWARWPAAQFGAITQGIIRFNTYLGLAIVGGLQGAHGLATASVMLAILVPVVNVISIWALLRDQSTGLRSLLRPMLSNPLILACIAGLAFNLAGIHLQWGSDKLVSMLSSTSLPLGLLCVGAALQMQELRGALRTLSGASLARLLLVPAVAWLCTRLVGLPPETSLVLIVFFALPTAPTSYVLTKQMRGDAHLMAGIVALQTVLSGITLPIWLLNL